MGKIDAHCLDLNCQLDCCREPAAAVLGSQALCLNHFVVHCYQQLGELDPRTRQIPNGAIELAQRMSEVDACSHAALRVCFTEQNLKNLDRGRLLDILLWAGELYALLHEPGVRLVNAWRPRQAHHDSRDAHPTRESRESEPAPKSHFATKA